MKSLKSKPKSSSSEKPKQTETAVNSIDLKQPPQDRASDYIKTGNIDGLLNLCKEADVVNKFHSKSGKCLLSIAAEEGSIDAIKALISFKSEVDIIDKSGIPPIIHASKFGHDHIIKYLVSVGANLNVVEIVKEENALMMACRFSQEKTAIYLITLGISLEHRNLNGEDALHTAVKYQCFEASQLLLEKGCNINSPSLNGNTILIRSAFDHREDTIQFLLKNSTIEIDTKNMNGETAFMVACRHGHILIAKTLLQHGTNVNNTDNFGRTSLLIAINGNKKNIIDMILELESVDVNICDQFGSSPLFMACTKDFNEQLIKKLLTMGAYINVMDRCLNTPLIYVCKHGLQGYIPILLEYGADSEIVNIENKKAVDYLETIDQQEKFIATVEYHLPKTSNHQLLAGRRSMPSWIHRLNNNEYIYPSTS